jgi:neutral ceramidase
MKASEAGPAQRLRAVFRTIDITPGYPVSLLGYFNDRVSTGVLDPLYCRLAGLATEGGRPRRGRARFRARGRPVPVRRLLFIQVDTCLIENGFAFMLRCALRQPQAGAWRSREVLVFANHTHTAPALGSLYEVPRQERYAAELLTSITAEAGAVAGALAGENRVAEKRLAAERPEAPVAAAPAAEGGSGRACPVSLWVARGRAEGLAFNRRWFLRNGRLLTNPPRALRAELAGPEGPVDPEVNTLLFRDESGKPLALFVSAVNHTDTIGGRRISADWTGALEREIGRALGRRVPVFPILGAQGNINHFDLSAEHDQTCYAEAQRLGREYAAAVLGSLKQAEPLAWDARRPALGSVFAYVRVPGRQVPAAELAQARALHGTGSRGAGGLEALTASDLAQGSQAVDRVLARELLRVAPARRRALRVPLQVARLGGALFYAIPGEPFVELGLDLKRVATARGVGLAMPVALANGYYGYILSGKSLLRGGYEALSVSGSLGGCAAARLLRACVALMELI